MAKFIHRPKPPIRVVIVTADNMTGELLTSVFNHGRKDFTFATLVGSSHKVLGELRSHEPDVALICAELQDGPLAGFNVLQNLPSFPHRTAAVMLLQTSTPECVVNAFRNGARGLFYRSHSLKALSKCIQTVHQGQIWARNEDLEHVMTALSHTKPLQFNDTKGMPLLTRREEDVVRLVADGLTNREIGQKLNVAEHTIRNYLYRILDKLGISNRIELVLYAVSKRGSSPIPVEKTKTYYPAEA
jgi:DNA-binding NarL/FixJ family response regulator